MRNLGLLAASCLVVLACGQVTSVDVHDGSDDAPTTGTGGAHGSGGSNGSGGVTGTGGSNGSGGSNGMDASSDIALSCDQLIAEYDVALKEAQVCNPLVKSLQCQATASFSLPCPGCVTHVQTTTSLDAIRAKWNEAGCTGRVCPGIACAFPGTGACVANDGGGGGTCTDDHLVGAN